MPRQTAIETEGRVTEVLPRCIFRVELPNGHRILAYLAASMRRALVSIDAGDRVKVEMSPFDFSKGCIVSKMQ